MLNTYTEASGKRRTFDSLGAFAAHMARRAAVNRAPVLIETSGEGLDVTELQAVTLDFIEQPPAMPKGKAGAFVMARGWSDQALMLILAAVAWGGCILVAAVR